MENCPIHVKQDVDIWSLGCVFSEVATWVVCNWKNVLEYRNQRRYETELHGRFRTGDYCFHDGQDGLLKCVDHNHHELDTRHVQAHDYVTTHVLKLVKDDMLRPSFNNGRRPASWLYGEADTMLKMVKEGLKPTPASTESVDSPGSNVSHPSSPALNTARPAPISPPPQHQYRPSEPNGGYFVPRKPSKRKDLSPDALGSQRDYPQASGGYHSTTIHDTATEDQMPQYFMDPFQSPNENQLQHRDPLPVWPVEEALRWRRVEKDRKNNEVVHMPTEQRLDDLAKRDHVRGLSPLFYTS